MNLNLRGYGKSRLGVFFPLSRETLSVLIHSTFCTYHFIVVLKRDDFSHKTSFPPTTLSHPQAQNTYHRLWQPLIFQHSKYAIKGEEFYSIYSAIFLHVWKLQCCWWIIFSQFLSFFFLGRTQKPLRSFCAMRGDE